MFSLVLMYVLNSIIPGKQELSESESRKKLTKKSSKALKATNKQEKILGIVFIFITC